MKKSVFSLFSIAIIASSMILANSIAADEITNESMNISASEVSLADLKPVPIEKVNTHIDEPSNDFTKNLELIVPEPETVNQSVEEAPSKEVSSTNEHSSSNTEPEQNNAVSSENTSKKSAAPDNGILFKDNIAGKLADPTHVPCGGLWEYYYDNFYAREINCGGSDIYLNLMKGDTIEIAGKTCKTVGSQQLNHKTDRMESVKWYGNTIVQTCYHGNTGKVRLVSFNCN